MSMRAAAWLVLLALAFRGPAAAAEGWLDLSPLPRQRQEVGIAEAGGKIYVLGGILQNRGPADLVDRYDPREGVWEAVAPLPAAIHHVGAAALGGRIYVVGGLNAAFDGVSSCYRYDQDRNAWDTLRPLPTRRGAMAVAALGGRIYAAGGQRAGASALREFAAFTPGPGLGEWEELPPMPTARNHLAGAAAAGFFYAISGRDGSGLRSEVERYNPAARAWSARAPIPTARGGIALAALGSRFFVFGGEGNPAPGSSGVFRQNEMYEAIQDRWFPRLDMSVPRHGIGAAALGGVIYIPGGAEVQGFGVTEANTSYRPPDADLAPILFLRGDANADGALNIADPVALLFSLFLGGPSAPCPDARDADDDGDIGLDDAMRILGHLFLGGEPPPAPWPTTGVDLTGDELGC